MRPQSPPGRAATSSACRPRLPLPACALTTGHASVVPTRLHTATKADRLREVASGSPASARTRSPVLCVRASRSIACVPRRATSRSSSRRLLCRRFQATRRSTSGGALSTRGSTSQAARRCAGPATRDECAEQHDVRRLPRRDDNARRTSSRNFTLRDCAETAQTAKPVELDPIRPLGGRSAASCRCRRADLPRGDRDGGPLACGDGRVGAPAAQLAGAWL
jgi:hypothetical protein